MDPHLNSSPAGTIDSPPRKPSASLIVPTKNEEENIEILAKEVHDARLPELYDLEMIFIDDGSTDRSPEIMKQLMAEYPWVISYRMDRSHGKSAAWDLGFMMAHGEYIVTIDADLQNDPQDIPGLIQLLEDGCDLASGRRRRRADTLGRKIQSRTANYVRRFVLNDNALDCGCGLKAFRRTCLSRFRLFNGAHRFLEAIFTLNGFRIDHMLVNDRPRRFGTAKYGLHNRLLGPLMDMFGVFWLKRRAFDYRYKKVQ